jgi:DNA-binding response OmpR family regulator
MTEDPAAAVFTIPGTPLGTETVLLVEDEHALRRLVTSVLELHGYTVLAAASASEALRIAETFESTIDLLLTDVDIPDMTGRQLAQRLRTTRLDMHLLYMSGRSEEDIAGYGVVASGNLFLEKPFTPYGLAWRVREVLDNTPTAARG